MSRLNLLLPVFLVIFILFNSWVVSSAGSSSGQPDINKLLNDLKDDNFKVSMEATEALIEIGEPAIPHLQNLLAETEDRWTLLKVVNVLKKINTPGTLPALLLALEKNEESVRNQARSVLEKLVKEWGEEVIPELEQALLVGTPDRRKKVVALLLETGYSKERLVKLLVSHLETNKQAVALEELARLAPEAAPALPSLFDLLKKTNNDTALRLKVINTITGIGGPEASRVMLELKDLLIKGNRSDREAVINNLLKVGCPAEEIATLLYQLLNEGKQDGEEQIIKTLGQLALRKKSTARFLIKVIEDESLSLTVKELAYRSLRTVAPRIEKLDRGLVAIKEDKGVYIGWRLLGNDPSDISFNLYRDRVKINSTPITSSTNFLDKNGSPDSTYYVCPVIDGVEKAASRKAKVLETNYLTVPLQKPAGSVTPDGVEYTYRANDASVGDLDGDGQYEIVLKWDPSNSKDNAHDGYTGQVYLDAYKLDGTHLWRINLGRNIRAGAHYTQFMVYDLDGDGKAEVACKTADGTVDGTGQVIGQAGADYRNHTGRILDGPEYLTVFEGQTGRALTTINFQPARGMVADWGDNYGNRVDRFLAAVAYLDGYRPSLIMARGYYEKTMLVAYNFRDGQLTRVWTFNTDDPGNEKYKGQGNHNLSVGDVDFDGRDEIVYGALVIDDNGKALYSTGLGHGDALHLGDFDPDRPGLEVFNIHESKSATYGADLREAGSGKLLWGEFTGKDTGRGMIADIDPRYKGEEAWAAGRVGVHTTRGEEISQNTPSINFGIWWDGDLLRELLDGNRIDKWDYKNNRSVNILTARECRANNGSKQTPCLQADILGDWREEVIWRTADSSSLRIYTTTDLTEYRIPTLMHDHVYRMGIAWQNVAYNQPPHTGFYLGAGMEEPDLISGDIRAALERLSPLFSK